MKSDRPLDTMLSGMAAGILLPAVTLVGFWLVKYDGGFFEFLSQFQGMGLLSKVISLSATPNLLLFFICIWTNRNFSARGVIFATLIVALVMLVLKFA
jgi:hypothetical protein